MVALWLGWTGIAAVAQPGELVLSGEDWTAAAFEPGQAVQERAFAEGYPTARALPATVPGDIHWDLERAGQVPPIYYGTNSQAIGWVAGKEWCCRKTFPVPPGWQSKRVRLQFDGADYLADVWLNGQFLGRHEGQFTPFEFEVAEVLRPGTYNTLSVLIHAAPASVREAIARGEGEWAVMQALRKAYPRWKCQANAGWDWGAKIITQGLWQDVRLVASDGVRLSKLIVVPRLMPNYEAAVLRVQVQADSPRPIQAQLLSQVRRLESADSPVLVTQAVSVAASPKPVEFEVTLPRPHLWWPNGYGAQPLYELVLTAHAQPSGPELGRAAATFGIRDLQLLPNPEAPDNVVYQDYTTDTAVMHQMKKPHPDLKYLLQINGRRIFARGANWLPCDLIYGRPRQPSYEHLVGLAAQAHFNLFRIWGGGLIEKPIFYELCDRYGILLFQEFPNAGVRLPETAEALAIAAEETREVLPLLVNHPCIVRYGGGNEWYRNAQNSPQMAQLRRLCNELDPTRPFHDPDPECRGQRHGPHAYDFATHYQTYNTGYPLTAGPDNPMEWTEYGASGAASVETLKRIMPAEHLWPIRASDPHWIWHKAFAAFGPDNWLGSAQYLQLFGELPDLETTVRCSQFVQAEGLRYANQAMRRRLWHRSACAFWTYNEPWPNAAHGCVVEYYGAPKMAYYYTSRSYAAVDVSAEYPSLVIQPGVSLPVRLFVTSSRPEALPACQLTAIVVDTQGREHQRANWRIDLAPDSFIPVGELELKAPESATNAVLLVQLELKDSTGNELSRETYTFGMSGETAKETAVELQAPALSPDHRRNLALLPSAKAAASSVLLGYPIHQIAHLNDGWYGNEASWIQGESPAWAEIDLGTVHQVTTVCVGNDHTQRYRDRGATLCRVLVATTHSPASDAPEWREVARHQGAPLQGVKRFDFEPVAARWVRIDLPEGAGVRIDEIEIYEAQPVPEGEIGGATAAVTRGPAPGRPAVAVPRGLLRPLLSAPGTQLALSVGSEIPSNHGNPSAGSCVAEVRNRGPVPALFVELSVETTAAGRWGVADNYFTLLAGETKRVQVFPPPGKSIQDLTVSRPMRLRARAWNAPEVSDCLQRPG